MREAFAAFSKRSQRPPVSDIEDFQGAKVIQQMIKIKWWMQVIPCLFLVGCAQLVFFGAGTAAGIVGYKYYEGALTVIYQAPFMESWDATLKALNQMNLSGLTASHDATSGRITARQADNTPVSVSLKYRSAKETEVTIRVGHLGDRNRSMAIKEEIRRVLVKE